MKRDRDRLAVGRVLRPHGVRGDLVVEATSELFRSLAPSSHVYVGDSEQASVILQLRPHRNWHLLRLEGCTDRTEAERFRNLDLNIALTDAEALPEGTYFHWQIIGLSVIDEDGEQLGEVEEIIETGANDVYVVRDRAGREILLPAIEEVVLEVDHEGGQMKVRLLPGMARPA